MKLTLIAVFISILVKPVLMIHKHTHQLCTCQSDLTVWSVNYSWRYNLFEQHQISCSTFSDLHITTTTTQKIKKKADFSLFSYNPRCLSCTSNLRFVLDPC